MNIAKKIIKIFLSSIGAIVAIAIIALWAVYSFFPENLIGAMQSGFFQGKEANSAASREVNRQELDGGIVLVSDVAYGGTRPNSFLDIYATDAGDGEPLPTFYYIHGGGYVWGDKTLAETLATGESEDYLTTVAKNGFNVVSIDYELFPEAVYPDVLYQIDESFKFLEEHAGEYGLDMNNLILCGASAGGQLAGQYLNIQLNADYAAKLGIEPRLSESQIKAVVFNSALLELEKFANTGSLPTNYVFGLMGKVYFGRGNLKKNENAIEGNVINHVAKNFPPTFITDGNSGTFTKQAKKLGERLSELGVAYTLNLYNKKDASLGHAYESTLNSAQSRDNFAEMIDFLYRYAK
jgi:acetyl esterase/lipase